MNNVGIIIWGTKGGYRILGDYGVDVREIGIRNTVKDIRSFVRFNKPGVDFYALEFTDKYKVFTNYRSVFEVSGSTGAYIAITLYLPHEKRTDDIRMLLNRLMNLYFERYVDPVFNTLRGDRPDDIQPFVDLLEEVEWTDDVVEQWSASEQDEIPEVFVYSDEKKIDLYFSTPYRKRFLAHQEIMFIGEEVIQNPIRYNVVFGQPFRQLREEEIDPPYTGSGFDTNAGYRISSFYKEKRNVLECLAEEKFFPGDEIDFSITKEHYEEVSYKGTVKRALEKKILQKSKGKLQVNLEIFKPLEWPFSLYIEGVEEGMLKKLSFEFASSRKVFNVSFNDGFSFKVRDADLDIYELNVKVGEQKEELKCGKFDLQDLKNDGKIKITLREFRYQFEGHGNSGKFLFKNSGKLIVKHEFFEKNEVFPVIVEDGGSVAIEYEGKDVLQEVKDRQDEFFYRLLITQSEPESQEEYGMVDLFPSKKEKGVQIGGDQIEKKKDKKSEKKVLIKLENISSENIKDRFVVYKEDNTSTDIKSDRNGNIEIKGNEKISVKIVDGKGKYKDADLSIDPGKDSEISCWLSLKETSCQKEETPVNLKKYWRWGGIGILLSVIVVGVWMEWDMIGDFLEKKKEHVKVSFVLSEPLKGRTIEIIQVKGRDSTYIYGKNANGDTCWFQVKCSDKVWKEIKDQKVQVDLKFSNEEIVEKKVNLKNFIYSISYTLSKKEQDEIRDSTIRRLQMLWNQLDSMSCTLVDVSKVDSVFTHDVLKDSVLLSEIKTDGTRFRPLKQGNVELRIKLYKAFFEKKVNYGKGSLGEKDEYDIKDFLDKKYGNGNGTAGEFKSYFSSGQKELLKIITKNQSSFNIYIIDTDEHKITDTTSFSIISGWYPNIR